MATKIEVKEWRGGEFEVRVVEGQSETTHVVGVSEEDFSRYAGGSGAGAAELVKKSFEFLLENEPKESILRRFQLREISRYFPGFEKEIKRRLAS